MINLAYYYVDIARDYQSAVKYYLMALEHGDNNIDVFDDFSKLFGEKVGDIFMSDIANSELRKMMFNDQGEPTLDKAFQELKK